MRKTYMRKRIAATAENQTQKFKVTLGSAVQNMAGARSRQQLTDYTAQQK